MRAATDMPLRNAEIAAIFTEIADLLEIEEANPFRVRAYRNAARIVSELGRDVRDMLARGEDLTRLPGIGADLAGKMREIVETGSCRALEKLRTELPPAVAELLHVPGLGPKRVRLLWLDLDVHTAEDLVQAARDGAHPRYPRLRCQDRGQHPRGRERPTCRRRAATRGPRRRRSPRH